MNHLSSTSFCVSFSSNTYSKVQFLLCALQEAPIWVKTSLFGYRKSPKRPFTTTSTIDVCRPRFKHICKPLDRFYHLQKSDIDFLFDGKGQLYSWKLPGKYTGLIETFGFYNIH